MSWNFFNNFISGFIIGVLSGFVASLLFDFYKRKRAGTKPYINSNVSNGVIRFDGQVENTQSSQQTLSRLIREC